MPRYIRHFNHFLTLSDREVVGLQKSQIIRLDDLTSDNPISGFYRIYPDLVGKNLETIYRGVEVLDAFLAPKQVGDLEEIGETAHFKVYRDQEGKLFGKCLWSKALPSIVLPNFPLLDSSGEDYNMRTYTLTWVEASNFSTQ